MRNNATSILSVTEHDCFEEDICDSLQQKVPYVAATSGCFRNILKQLLINTNSTKLQQLWYEMPHV